jgi:hypothetical protein
MMSEMMSIRRRACTEDPVQLWLPLKRNDSHQTAPREDLILGASWQTEGLRGFPEASAELGVLDGQRVFYYLTPITRADV